ncbi:MAG TPA: helix-turn-helix transcriptional regulator [Mycobacteriales bacterium]|nr:helix-turn-helix transcriptional regulator [Mycobacteriales bacterium]
MTTRRGVDPSGIATRAEFAAQLTVLRERAGLSARELARSAGVPLATVGGYLSGRHLPTAASRDVLLRVLDACGVGSEDADDWIDAAGRARRNGRPSSRARDDAAR